MEILPRQPVPVLSVVELSRRVKDLLEGAFPRVSVRGEVSGFKRATSGHAYFSLCERDPDGQALKLDCAVYRFSRAAARLDLRDGQKVVVTGRVTSWGGSSKYQLTVDHVEDEGHGDLLRQLQELKQRLLAEGVFDPERKRPLPFLPRCVGVVTSIRGAAVRDIVRTVLARWPARILLVDAVVQGEGAAARIAAGIELLNRVPEVDVIVVGRGGGSVEDLWAFNEEVLVRAVAASAKPVVSAVGHEVDHVLTDDAADVRSATPTAAGVLVVPSREQVAVTLASLRDRLAGSLERRVESAGQRLDELEARLRGAGARVLGDPRGRVVELGARLGRLGTRVLAEPRHRVAVLDARLAARHPARLLADERRRACALSDRLRGLGPRLLDAPRGELRAMGLRLAPLDPFAPLDRGYALARTAEGHVVHRYDQVPPGASIEVLLREGALACEVVEGTPGRPS
jgi:exodeoxyribonuclease VII large subunit